MESVELKHFNYKHLPEHLQSISKPFHDLAWQMTYRFKDGDDMEQLKFGLQKLLEAKDCAVRSKVG